MIDDRKTEAFMWATFIGAVLALLIALIAVSYFDAQNKRAVQLEMVKHGVKPTEVACLVK